MSSLVSLGVSTSTDCVVTSSAIEQVLHFRAHSKKIQAHMPRHPEFRDCPCHLARTMAPRAALASAMLLLRAVAFSPARMPANPSRARWVTTASKTRWTNPAEWFKSKASDQDAANATQDGDITSSPVFLKKKVDVLTKELEDYSAKIEEVLAAKQVVDEEWGPKLQNLRNEYSAIASARTTRASTRLASRPLTCSRRSCR